MSKRFLFQAIQFRQTVLIQAFQFNISIVFVHRQLNVKTVLFQTILFNISTLFTCQNSPISSNSFYACMHVSSIWPIDGTRSGATNPGPSGLGTDGDEGELRIPQSITGASPSDCLSGTFVGGGLTPLQRCSRCILRLGCTCMYVNVYTHKVSIG